MTFDKIWLLRWQEYMSYLEANKRRPSKYHVEDKRLVNWLKYNRKMSRNGKLDEVRKEKLDILLVEANKYRRVNQHSYYNK
jgi:hypothetical protein